MNFNYLEKERVREEEFSSIWNEEINDVFLDVAKYYDKANDYASLGLLSGLRRRFTSSIDVQPGQRVLDVCAGTNVIGIALLNKQPDIAVHAVDRSEAMQTVGKERAEKRGFSIDSTISDVHKLPYPDNHFDVITLQFATRHLRVAEVFAEINRVLKPGGFFYHCDMLRPENKLIEQGYYLYLRACLFLVSSSFRSAPAAMRCRDYFVQAIRLFYSTDELSQVLKELGFTKVKGKSVLCGTIAFHQACKA